MATNWLLMASMWTWNRGDFILSDFNGDFSVIVVIRERDTAQLRFPWWKGKHIDDE